MNNQYIVADACALPVGPYSHAVVSDGMIYCSGQIGIDRDGRLVADDVAAQTHQIFANIQSVLQAAGSELSDIVKTTIFLTSIADFARVNEIYATYLPHKPARSTIEIAALPLGAVIEIECIACVRSM